jgi:hypothetical protein
VAALGAAAAPKVLEAALAVLQLTLDDKAWADFARIAASPDFPRVAHSTAVLIV